MPAPGITQQALNKAMLEAVNFVHAEGWDAQPTLFALVPTQLIVDALDDELDDSPLTLVIQDELPDNLDAGTDELGDYCARVAWPREVEGVILAQEIVFRDAADTEAGARPARLYSGVLRDDSIEQTLLQLRPTDEELKKNGPFAEDNIELRGGPGVAPGILEALRAGLTNDPDDDLFA